MDNLYAEISAKVSSKYHARIREILTVFDTTTPCDVVVDSNAAIFHHNFSRATSSESGYVSVDHNIMTLNGIVNVFPTLRIEGELVVILAKNFLFNPHNGEDKVKHTLLIFEKKPNLISRIRGVV